MATAVFDATDRSGTRRPTADDARALDALAYAVDGGERIVLLEGSSRFRRSALLLELARRIESTHRPVLASGDLSRPQMALIEQVCSMAGLPPGADPHGDLAHFLERSANEGRHAVVLLDEAHRVSESVLHQLIELIQNTQGRASAILAVPQHGALLSVLKGGANFVDLVRLGTSRAERDVLDRPASPRPSPTPARQTPTARETRPRGMPDMRSRAADVLPVAGGFESPAPDPDERLSTIEELLGDAAMVPEARQRDESRGELATHSTETAPTVKAADQWLSVPSLRSAESASPRLAAASVATERVSPARRASNVLPDPTLDRSTIRPGPRSSVSRRLRTFLGALALGAGLLALWLLSLDPSPTPPRDPLAETNRPGNSFASVVESAQSLIGARATETTGAEAVEERASDPGRGGQDLQNALAILSTDLPPAEREAAVQFLKEHGPDAAAYEFLVNLTNDPELTLENAAEMLGAQSRLRRALCSAWADDPRGDAPIRLGCPGAVSPRP